MEFKVRKESQSVLDKTFETYEKQGVVRGYQIASMLRTISPDLPIAEKELEKVLNTNDPQNTGKFDLETFNKVAIHFLVKMAKQEHDEFAYKKDISVHDFA